MADSEFEHSIGYTCTDSGSLHYHPNGSEYLYIQGATIVVSTFPDESGDQRQQFLRGHATDLSTFTISEKGKFLASAEKGTDSDIVVWDYDTRECVFRFEEHDGGVVALAFSHDERLLASVGLDRRIIVWDLKTGMIVSSAFLPHNATATAVTFGGFLKDIKRRPKDEYQFATAGNSVLLWVLDPYGGSMKMVKANAGRNSRSFTCLSFAKLPDSSGSAGLVERILAGTTSGDLIDFIVSPQLDGMPIVRLVGTTSLCAGGIHSLRVEASANAILLGCGDGGVRHINYDKDTVAFFEYSCEAFEGAVHGLSLSSDHSQLIFGTKKGKLYKAPTASLREAQELSSSHCGSVTGVAFLIGSNEAFATCSEDGTVRVFSTNDYKITMETRVPGGVPTNVIFTEDFLLSSWMDGCIRCHGAKTGDLLWSLHDAHVGGVTGIAISKNMRFIVSGGEEGDVRVWELRSRELVSHLKEHSLSVTSVAIFDDDAHAITCSRDRSLLCWDLRAEKRISAHTQRMGAMNCLGLLHDQTVVATVGQERSVTLWDLRADRPLAVVQRRNDACMHSGEVTAFAVANDSGADGGLFATGGVDGIVKLWRSFGSGSVKHVRDNTGHSGPIRAMSFSLDDRQLVSVGDDGSIFVWSIFHDEQETKT